MRIWHYSAATGELLGAGTADPDPRQPDSHLVPANATSVAPPDTGSDAVARFDPAARQWSVVEDHRGATAYDIATGEAETVHVLGSIPPDRTLAVPGPDDRWDLEVGAWVEDPTRRADRLTAARAEAAAALDRAAERARLAGITSGDGQAMVYEAKAQEAAAAVSARAAGASLEPADYPFLAAEVGITGDVLGDVAVVILARRAEWTRTAAAIEAARLGGKAAIEAAADPDAVAAARDRALTDLAALATAPA